ncbi:MAG TPA: DUF192 domain-containing protein [Dehalococcoidia bacterium]|jgi:uncharacterized membrane protein (UPF0127 family)|nr:DUF192 domain-containing protein [Dehalococcoidia bacterium]
MVKRSGLLWRAVALVGGALLSLNACTGSNAAAPRAVTRTPAQPASQTAAASVGERTATPARVAQSATDLTPIYFTDQNGNSVELDVEIASTEQEREIGLMNRASMPESQGMVFIWPAPVDYHAVAFWNKDVEFPLDVAFISADGTIVSFVQMPAGSTDYYLAAGPFQYAVETNAGWFYEHGVYAGSSVDLTRALQQAPNPEP